MDSHEYKWRKIITSVSKNLLCMRNILLFSSIFECSITFWKKIFCHLPPLPMLLYFHEDTASVFTTVFSKAHLKKFYSEKSVPFCPNPIKGFMGLNLKWVETRKYYAHGNNAQVVGDVICDIFWNESCDVF